MKTVYTFEPKELAFIREATAELERRLRNIAEINRIQGAFTLSPDGLGFAVSVAPSA